MTQQQIEQLVAFFVINLPFVTVIVIGQRRGWWVDGRAHDREIAEKDKFIAFLTELWKTSVVDKTAVEDRSLKQSEAMKELTSVIRESLGFQKELVNDARERDWTRTPARGNRPARQRPREEPRPNSQSTEGS